METNIPESFTRFRRALRRSDQAALDDLFGEAEKHLDALIGSNCTITLDTILVCLLLVEHKEVIRLRKMLEDILTWPPSA